jgi:hypothetical protein
MTDLLPDESVVQETTEAISNWDFSLYLGLSGDTSLPAGAKFIFSVSAFALDNEQSTEQHVYVTVNTPPTPGGIQVCYLDIVPSFSRICKDRSICSRISVGNIQIKAVLYILLNQYAIQSKYNA